MSVAGKVHLSLFNAGPVSCKKAEEKKPQAVGPESAPAAAPIVEEPSGAHKVVIVPRRLRAQGAAAVVTKAVSKVRSRCLHTSTVRVK
jgi:hypothetical protein